MEKQRQTGGGKELGKFASGNSNTRGETHLMMKMNSKTVIRLIVRMLHKSNLHPQEI